MGIKNNEKEGGSAFPKAGHHQNGNGQVEGMSLRDYFAAKAMQALVASLGQHSVSGAGGSAMYGTPEIHARSAYAYADAMLAERAK
jgi:hypothetical protein